MAEIGFIAPKVAAEIENWLHHLGAERQLSPKTLEAYRRDVMQFLAFSPASRRCAVAEGSCRAYARRRARLPGGAAGKDIGSRSLMRTLAGTRAFARFLERAARARSAHSPRYVRRNRQNAATAARRRRGKDMADPDIAAGDGREPWIHARDAAVLGLLYGCGLRISEALGLKAR